MKFGINLVMQNPGRQQNDHQVYWDERKLAEENMRRFATKVMPAFKEEGIRTTSEESVRVAAD
jgi:hypothetical protein